MIENMRRDGDRIGNRYRIIARLNAGGMGITYRAWDELAGRPVVVKEPQRRLLNAPGFLERFDREIHALVNHPHQHIVPVLDVGADDGLPFYVMRFLPGGSLSDRRLRDNTGAVRQMLPSTLHLWIWQIAATLDFIHAAGIVHRDVKPANIFFDSGWGAFLGDFGVVKAMADPAAQDLTGTHDAIGTDKYMAPEQVGARTAIDGRADQYALAVIAYDLMAGRAPFIGDTAHVFVEIATQPPPSLNLFRQDLPSDFQTALYRALAKDPSDRFDKCTAFVRALLRGVPQITDEIGIARFLCPKCRTILRLPTSAGGQQGRCPRCRKGMMVATDLSALWLLSEASAIGGSTEPEPATVFDQVDPVARPAIPAPAPTPPKPIPAVPPAVPPPIRPAFESAEPLVFDDTHRPDFPPVSSIPRTQLIFAVAIATAMAAAGLLAWVALQPGENPIDAAFRTLETTPQDPAANDIVGRFYAREGKWPQALPHLAASKRPDYRDVARLELQGQSSPQPAAGELLAVCQAWWKLAGLIPRKSLDQKAIEAHAVEIYQSIVNRLVDLGDVEETNEWLDRDDRFRSLVNNQRPQRVAPRWEESFLCDMPTIKTGGNVRSSDHTLVMKPAANGEAKAVFAVPRGATTLAGSVRVSGNPNGQRLVFQVARPAGSPYWESKTLLDKDAATEPFQILVSDVRELELRVKIPGGAVSAEWLDVRFVIPKPQ